MIGTSQLSKKGQYSTTRNTGLLLLPQAKYLSCSYANCLDLRIFGIHSPSSSLTLIKLIDIFI